MKIIVARYEGDIQGKDVISSLLTNTLVGINRGRRELDVGEGLQIVNLTSVYKTGLAKGDLVDVDDLYQGEVWKGIITGINHVADGQKIVTQLTIKRKQLG